LLNPGLLEIPVIPVILRICPLNADTGRSCVGERSGLCLNSSVLVTVIGDERRAFGGLVIRGREHFPSTGYEFVERR